MYDIIQDIIDHVFQSGTGTSGDQQYIYYICMIVIPLCIIIAVDLIHSIFKAFTRK